MPLAQVLGDVNGPFLLPGFSLPGGAESQQSLHLHFRLSSWEGGGAAVGGAYPWCLLETTSICHSGNQLFSDDDTVLSVKKTLLFFLFYLHDSDLVK